MGQNQAAQVQNRLAIEGGTPVISRTLNHYKGAAVIGEQEKQAALEVLDSQSLFRYYGPKLLSKVANFEADFARFVGARHAAAATSGTMARWRSRLTTPQLRRRILPHLRCCRSRWAAPRRRARRPPHQRRRRTPRLMPVRVSSVSAPAPRVARMMKT